MIQLTQGQRTRDWYKARLGMFTASQVHKLMGKTDLSRNTFGDTAYSYLALLAGERKLKETKWDSLSDEEVDDFVKTQYQSNRAMAWGTFYEESARNLFAFENDKIITELGSCVDDERPYLSASPDGLIDDENALVEIKCPQLETYCKYCDKIVDAITLKETKPEYYWQIFTQMHVMKADLCYFVWYHPYLGEEFVIIQMNEDINLLLNRIDKAEEIVQSIYNKL